MISRLRGKIRDRREDSILVDVNGISYSVLLPMTTMNSVDNMTDADDNIELVTYHYLQSDMTKSTPVLIGFQSEVEREFFERFITVSGIGPRAAVKALNMPISEAARAIDEADIAKLKSMPGIGEQKARDIIARLQGRVGKFGLIQDGGLRDVRESKEDIKLEALEVLSQLRYNKKQAAGMVESALKRQPDIKTAEELLNEVYRQRSNREGTLLDK